MIFNFNEYIINEKSFFNIEKILQYGDDYGWHIPYIQDTTNNNEEYNIQLSKDIEEFIDHLNEKYNLNDPNYIIPIYRVISLNDKNDLNTNNLGKCWTMDKDSYKYYIKSLDGYKRNKMYLIESSTKVKNIDWYITIYQNMLSSGENEIRIKDDSKLILSKFNKIST